ncbi:MAG TPA: SpoIIE family protein phosphatase, partial [Candidatus Polarisedimenticolia bacterium]|nr:SpoIIE family protein phosphatase [Candidatus Polarisedimenticolia bacterium]
HPFRNVVTRALGSRDDVAVDLVEEGLKPDDILVLCSDGLNTMIDDEMIAATVLTHADDIDAAAQALIGRANENGGDDNVTVIVVKVQADGRATGSR